MGTLEPPSHEGFLQTTGLEPRQRSVRTTVRVVSADVVNTLRRHRAPPPAPTPPVHHLLPPTNPAWVQTKLRPTRCGPRTSLWATTTGNQSRGPVIPSQKVTLLTDTWVRSMNYSRITQGLPRMFNVPTCISPPTWCPGSCFKGWHASAFPDLSPPATWIQDADDLATVLPH